MYPGPGETASDIRGEQGHERGQTTLTVLALSDRHEERMKNCFGKKMLVSSLFIYVFIHLSFIFCLLLRQDLRSLTILKPI